MRRKPTYEELASAANKKKTVLAKPPPAWVPHNDNAVAVAQLRSLSDGLKSTQRDSQITRARAEAIVVAAGAKR